jgi:hypothetical protein
MGQCLVVLIGGFAHDTDKPIIETFLKQYIICLVGPGKLVDICVPGRLASNAKALFQNSGTMRDFLKGMKGRKLF